MGNGCPQPTELRCLMSLAGLCCVVLLQKTPEGPNFLFVEKERSYTVLIIPDRSHTGAVNTVTATENNTTSWHCFIILTIVTSYWGLAALFYWKSWVLTLQVRENWGSTMVIGTCLMNRETALLQESCMFLRSNFGTFRRAKWLLLITIKYVFKCLKLLVRLF